MTNLAIRDTLYNIIGGLIVVLFFMFFLVRPVVTEEAEDAKSPGNMIVSAAWPDGPIDVDIWLIGPGETNAIGYSNRAGKLFNLLRDDLGTNGDSMPLNYENAYSRGLPAGQYIINIHGYSLRTGPVDVAVEIRFGRQGHPPKLFLEETLTLAQAQERTVVSFRLDDKGEVVPGSVNRVFHPLRSATK